jgi:hypothetical protein
MAYSFNGKELKKTFVSVIDKDKRPYYVAAESAGHYVWCHLVSDTEGDQIWSIECDMLTLAHKLDLTAMLDKSGPRRGAQKWSLAADCGWLLVLVSKPDELGGNIHRFKNMKYMGVQEIKHSANYIELRGNLLILGNTPRKSVYYNTFDPASGLAEELNIDSDVYNGNFALLSDGTVVTVNPVSFMLTGTNPLKPTQKTEQRLLKTIAPIAGMDDGIFCSWDRTHREIIVMKL